MIKQEIEKKGVIWTMGIIILMEMGAVFFAVKQTWVDAAILSDRVSFQQLCGVEQERKLMLMTKRWYSNVFEKTGIITAVNDYVFTQWEENEKTATLHIDDHGLSELVKGRIITIWGALYAAFYRFGQIYIWFLVIIPVFICVYFDAMAVRKVRKEQLFTPSPALHSILIKIIYTTIFAFILLPFAPISFPAWAVPFAILLIALSSWLWTINLSKNF